MRTLAIGDIHGCYRSLTSLAEFVPFKDEDTLITLGDYVNRGPDSYSVIEWLIERERIGRVILLRGNHEIMMCQAKRDAEEMREWLDNGGDTTLASYSVAGFSHFDEIPQGHWDFLENSLLPFFEIDTHFFVHANAYPDFPIDDQPEYMLYWESFGEPAAHDSGKIMVCGHTPQKSGQPLNVGHAVCIDTWAQGDGWLTCLDVKSGRYWQANEKGEARSDWLTEPAN
jgi:serine/threonine protein phosphatase 1